MIMLNLIHNVNHYFGFNNSCTNKMKIVLLFKKEMIQRDQQKINGKL